MQTLNYNNNLDIYFEKNYGKLYEKIENGKVEVFHFKSEIGEVRHLFLKRIIPIEIDGEIYHDIVTPYGYGGPVILWSKDNKKDELISQFDKSFKKYCDENNIVSEFIRFHPILENEKDFRRIYSIEFNRKTLGTNLKDYDDPVKSEFSKSARKTIRRAIRAGLNYRVITSPNNLKKFKEIYYSTMKRNEAKEYYYFGENYFDNILKYFRDNIILIEVLYEDEVIAAGLYLAYGKIIHAHLSGTLSEFLHLSPAYIIKFATVLWGKKNGFDLIHYGGGTTNSPDDLLFKFKKKFSKNTEFEFYIGKKIWNEDVYTQLCNIVNVEKSQEFFPAYRMKE